MGDNLVTIGAFAAATGLSVPALRHYDEIGLLTPAQVDPDTGYRRYRHDQIDQALLICGLRGLELPIDEIRGLVGRDTEDVRRALDAHRERLVAQARDLSQRIAAVDEFLDKGTHMPNRSRFDQCRSGFRSRPWRRRPASTRRPLTSCTSRASSRCSLGRTA